MGYRFFSRGSRLLTYVPGDLAQTNLVRSQASPDCPCALSAVLRSCSTSNLGVYCARTQLSFESLRVAAIPESYLLEVRKSMFILLVLRPSPFGCRGWRAINLAFRRPATGRSHNNILNFSPCPAQCQPLFGAIEYSHSGAHCARIQMSIPGSHLDSFMSCCFLNDFQGCTRLRQPATEGVPQIVPAKMFDLCFFRSLCPPFLIVPNREHGIRRVKIWAVHCSSLPCQL